MPSSHDTQRSRSLFAPRLLLLLSLGLLFQGGAAHAAAIFVNTLADELNNDGDCSLREAVQAANTNVAVDDCVAGNSGNNDGIIILVAGTVSVGPTLSITEGVNIAGGGPGALTIAAGDGTLALIEVSLANTAHDFTLTGMRFSGQTATSARSAINLRGVDVATLDDVEFDGMTDTAVVRPRRTSGPAGQLRITDAGFIGNQSASGGGALRLASLTSIEIARARFESNVSDGDNGGAAWITESGLVQIEDAAFVDNHVVDTSGASPSALLGGGLNVMAASELRLARSSFVGGSAVGGGGAIYLVNVSAKLDNLSVYGDGNLVLMGAGSTAELAHSTVVRRGLESAFGVIGTHGELSIRSSLIDANSPQQASCSALGLGSVISQGGNAFPSADTSCNPHVSDREFDDRGLLPIGDYGGLVPVMLPSIDSVVIDAGPVTTCPGADGLALDHDARGRPRPVASDGSLMACDIGSVEWSPATDDWIFKYGMDF